jgi:hypothetical protein
MITSHIAGWRGAVDYRSWAEANKAATAGSIASGKVTGSGHRHTSCYSAKTGPTAWAVEELLGVADRFGTRSRVVEQLGEGGGPGGAELLERDLEVVDQLQRTFDIPHHAQCRPR